MYSEFLNLDTEDNYRQHYYANYCSHPITTQYGVTVSFDRATFDHAFYGRTNRRQEFKDRFDLDRAKRINWIKKVLEDSQISIFQGWDSRKKCYDSMRRVSLVTSDGYVVVIRFTNRERNLAKFVTAYVVDDINVLNKIKNSPRIIF